MSANDFYSSGDNKEYNGNQGGDRPDNAHEGERGFLSTVAGGIAGGYAGNTLGDKKGHGTLGTIVGAIGGAIAANKLEDFAEDKYAQHKQNQGSRWPQQPR
ncbi:unnamed protein product [Ambrosiozyma monospora]|uniref:Unnamed protein product n=1 Tax=Ambrosiozyma monospora TaxID=43982 RepID=A0ACB5TAE3_AMBMO|nr:unnamed protein product [Ambrosiozyma monospora]